MQQIDTYVSVTEAKKKLLELVRRLGKADEIVAITRDGTPAAVLLSMRHYEELAETLDILSDARTMASLRRSLRQAAQGKWTKHEHIFPAEET